MDKETIEKIKKIEDNMDNTILKLFGFDKVDEIILTKEELKTNLRFIRLIFFNEIIKVIMELKEFKNEKSK